MSIEFRKEYIDAMDEALVASNPFKSLFDANPGVLKWLQKAEEVKVPKFALDGPTPLTSGQGYTTRNVSLSYETVKADLRIGGAYPIDPVDNMDTDGFLKETVVPEYVRTEETPYVAAYIASKLAQTSGIGTATAALSTGADVLAALKVAADAMDEGHVPGMRRHLYIVPKHMSAIDALDTTKSRAVLGRFDVIDRTPQDIMYSKITQYDGTTSGQEAGGYVKAADGLDINFIAVWEPAVIAGIKHRELKYIEGKYNPNSPSDLFCPDTVGYCKVKENQVAGVYVHLAPAANAGGAG